MSPEPARYWGVPRIQPVTIIPLPFVSSCPWPAMRAGANATGRLGQSHGLLDIRDQPDDGSPQDLPLGIIFWLLETVGGAFHRLLFALWANTTARRHHVLAAALADDRHRPVAQQDLKRKAHVSTAILEPTRLPGRRSIPKSILCTIFYTCSRGCSAPAQLQSPPKQVYA